MIKQIIKDLAYRELDLQLAELPDDLTEYFLNANILPITIHIHRDFIRAGMASRLVLDVTDIVNGDKDEGFKLERLKELLNSDHL